MKKIIALLLFILTLPQVVIAENEYATVFHPDTGDRKAVAVGDPQAFAGGYLLEVGRVADDEDLGFALITNYRQTISVPMNTSQTYVPVTSLDTTDNHTITSDDIGDKIYLTLGRGDSLELVRCTGVGELRFTGCTRGLAFYGKSITSVTANIKQHTVGETVIVSDTHHIFNELLNKDDDQTLDGLITFSQIPLIPTTTPTLDAQAVSKKYADDLTNAGAADGAESTKGIWEGATQSEMSSGTVAGETGANLILQSQYASSTPDGITIPVTETDGDLNAEFIGQDQDYTWSGEHSFSNTNSFTGENTFTATTTLATTTVTDLSADSLTLNGSDTSALVGGGDADSLHTHDSIGVQFDGGSVYSGSGVVGWTDVDASSIVGTSTAVLMLKVVGRSNSTAFVRQNGDSSEFDHGTKHSGASGAQFDVTNGAVYLFVKTDNNGVFEIKHSDNTSASIIAYWK